MTMKESQIFNGRVPVEPEVNQLKKTIQIELNKLISHAEIEHILQLKRTTNRYRRIVRVWRDHIEKEQSLRLAPQLGAGFLVLNPEGALKASEKDMGDVMKRTVKAAVRVEMIDPLGLSEHSKMRHALTRRQAHLMTHAAQEAGYEITAPAPTTSIVRMAKTAE